MGDERGTRGRPRRFVVFETRVPIAAGARRCGGAYKLHFTSDSRTEKGIVSSVDRVYQVTKRDSSSTEPEHLSTLLSSSTFLSFFFYLFFFSLFLCNSS